VIVGWILLVIAAVLIGGAAGRQYLADQDLGDGDSGQADQVLASAGFDRLADEEVLVQAQGAGPTVADPAFRAAVQRVVARLERFGTVTDVRSPLTRGGRGQISPDGRSALVSFDVRGDRDEAKTRVVPVLEAVAAIDRTEPRLRIEQFGEASAARALSLALHADFRKAEALSLPITLAILVLAFGALVAAGLPLMLGLSAVAITLGLLAPLSHVWPVDEAVSSVVLLIGLAVGVDYSMFYIRRDRDERAAGRSPQAALDVAARTSGRAVLISGCTVMVAMAGMYITDNATFQSFATGTIMVVAVAVVGSLTVLPAVLSRLGDDVDRGRVPFLRRHRREGADRGFWATVVGSVLRHPVASMLLATALLLVLALPTLRLHTANSGVQGLPRELPILRTYDRIQRAFPGQPLAATVVVQLPGGDVRSPRVATAIRALRDRAVLTGLMHDPVTTVAGPDRTVAAINVPLAGQGTDDTSNRALALLRSKVVPATVGRLPGARVHTTGLTAGSYDFNQLMEARAPWVFAFVLALAFVLLLVTFRSIVIPIKAIILNLLSVGAAYGVVVWIFQDGHLESVLGFTSIGGITSWLPLFLFVVLFGLSMDYHVFILSRVREGYDHGMPTEEAVSHGIRATAGVVTSAAAVMIGVFSIFATLSALDFKEMGVGLALAVLIDATLVRAVLLPASMKVLGDWNWYLPSWLAWLPRLEAEPQTAEGEPRAGPVTGRAPGRPAAP
jgi:RND superfamily putative drug exporter